MAAAGLSEREQAGCRQLLELLGTEELLALTDTITNRLVHPESRQGAAAPPRAGGGGGGGAGWRRVAAPSPQPPAPSPQPPSGRPLRVRPRLVWVRLGAWCSGLVRESETSVCWAEGCAVCWFPSVLRSPEGTSFSQTMLPYLKSRELTVLELLCSV